jgi:hypothetical protein
MFTCNNPPTSIYILIVWCTDFLVRSWRDWRRDGSLAVVGRLHSITIVVSFVAYAPYQGVDGGWLGEEQD